MQEHIAPPTDRQAPVETGLQRNGRESWYSREFPLGYLELVHFQGTDVSRTHNVVMFDTEKDVFTIAEGENFQTGKQAIQLFLGEVQRGASIARAYHQTLQATAQMDSRPLLTAAQLQRNNNHGVLALLQGKPVVAGDIDGAVARDVAERPYEIGRRYLVFSKTLRDGFGREKVAEMTKIARDTFAQVTDRAEAMTLARDRLRDFVREQAPEGNDLSFALVEYKPTKQETRRARREKELPTRAEVKARKELRTSRILFGTAVTLGIAAGGLAALSAAGVGVLALSTAFGIGKILAEAVLGLESLASFGVSFVFNKHRRHARKELQKLIDVKKKI